MQKLTHLLKKFAAYFLAGLLVVLPIVLTISVVAWVGNFVYQILGPGTFLGNALRAIGLNFAANSTAAYILGWVIVLAVVFGLGLLVESGAKRFVTSLFDGLTRRIPVIGSIYGTSKQLVAMFDRKNESEMKSMSVVWCFFSTEGGAAVLALMPTAERFQIDGRDHNVVIIPTAPVPFGGALVFVPAECVKISDMPVDGLMSIYVSMGITTPQFLQSRAAG